MQRQIQFAVFVSLFVASCVTQPQPTSSRPAAARPGDALATTAEPVTGDRLPKIIRMRAPVYPYQMQRKGISAVVNVQFVVRTDGSVVVERVLNCPDPSFDQSVIKAARDWRFEPGVKNGKIANIRITVPVTFSIDDETKPNQSAQGTPGTVPLPATEAGARRP